MIPRIIHRTLPAEPNPGMLACWESVLRLTPDWEHRTYQSPRSADDWPLTQDVWEFCPDNGVNADLVRLEALWNHGGVYLDADVELLRPLEPLLDGGPFAAYETYDRLCNAVIGAPPKHPAVGDALEMLKTHVREWDAPIGPRSLTAAWEGRDDVRLLPSETFYPYGFWEKERAGEDFTLNPNTFGVHHWHATWFKP